MMGDIVTVDCKSQMTVTAVAKVGHDGRGKTDGRFDRFLVPFARWAIGEKVYEQIEIELLLLLELPDHRRTAACCASPVDQTPAIACPPVSQAVKITGGLVRRPELCGLARADLVEQSHPVRSQVSTAGKDNDPFYASPQSIVADQPQGKSS